ncbi:hypothetical protein N5J31_01675 [Acinetobacter johnsonii]|uniref:hypothetical protein n=1 Tax=Acinetobacter johnsonii TaxID=40214 RepID=UPI00244CE5EF|nr:hypothetical protein [Acinetobacter johnsonii]MDH2045636.1 hypothetical protein [Acinetobacter johnsonii]
MSLESFNEHTPYWTVESSVSVYEYEYKCEDKDQYGEINKTNRIRHYSIFIKPSNAVAEQVGVKTKPLAIGVIQDGEISKLELIAKHHEDVDDVERIKGMLDWAKTKNSERLRPFNEEDLCELKDLERTLSPSGAPILGIDESLSHLTYRQLSVLYDELQEFIKGDKFNSDDAHKLTETQAQITAAHDYAFAIHNAVMNNLSKGKAIEPETKPAASNAMRDEHYGESWGSW